MISLNSRLDRAHFGSRHYISSELGNGRQLIILSGIVVLDWMGERDAHVGEATQFEWYREQLSLRIDFDGLVSDERWFHIEQWAPIISLNAFDVQVPPDGGLGGGGFYHYPGVAVDSFWLEFADPSTDVLLRGDIAVKYPASHLYRIAYHITLTGLFVAPPPAPW